MYKVRVATIGTARLIVSLLLAVSPIAATHPPGEKAKQVKYKVVLKRPPEAPPGDFLYLHVAIKESDLSLQNLIKLTEELKDRYSKETRITAEVFVSEKAARKMNFTYEQGYYKDLYAPWRADYRLDRTAGEEYLKYMLEPNKPGKEMKRIELGKPRAPTPAPGLR